MALTVTPTADAVTAAKRHVIGDIRIVYGEIQFDNSYPTGGEAIVAKDLGFDVRIDEIFFQPFDNAASRIAVYDKAAGKVKLFTAMSTEAANASDQSTIKVRFVAYGK